MSIEQQQVITFYREIWNNHDTSIIPQLLHETFRFRGSLGVIKNDRAGFIEYVDMIHQSLGDYHCEIEEMVVQAPKVFAKMMFTGIHQEKFMGFSPTGKPLSWAGAALFTFSEGKISDLWVLGDIKGLERQLSDNVKD